MKKVFLPLLLILFIFNPVTKGQTYKYEDVINFALTNNPKLKKYEVKKRIAELKYKSAWGNFFPAVNLEGGLTRLNSPLELDLEPFRKLIIQLQANNQVEIRNIYNMLAGNPSFSPSEKAVLYNQYSSLLSDAVPGFAMTFKDQNFKAAKLTAVQPLFLGGKLLAYKDYRKAEENISDFEYEKIKNEIIAETTLYFLNTALLQEIIKVRKEVVAGIERHKREAEKLYQSGVISRNNVLKAEVALEEAKQKLLEDENRLNLALLALSNAMGMEEFKPFNVEHSFIFVKINANIDELTESANYSQPVLKILEEKAKSAEANYKIQRSDFLPSIAAFGTKELYPEYLSVLEPEWAIGVQFKWNIFNGFKDYLELEEAKLIEKEVEFTSLDIKKKINLWINKAYTEMRNYEAEYNKMESDIQLAKENLRINSKRFNTGMGTSLEVIDAQLSLESSKIKRIVTLHNYYKAVVDLYTAAGETSKVLEIIK